VTIEPLSPSERASRNHLRNLPVKPSLPIRLAGALAILVLAACAQLGGGRFESPEIALESLRILRIVDAKADLTIGLRVYNPNEFPLSVDQLEFDVTIDGRNAASGRTSRVGELRAHGDASVDVAGRVDIGAVATGLMTLASQLPIDYTVNGSVTLTDGTKLPFAKKGRVPVTRVDRGFGPKAP